MGHRLPHPASQAHQLSGPLTVVLTLIAAAVALSACGSTDITGGTSGLNPPANLTYQLVPSGDPTTPESIMLRWDAVDDSRITNYVVYSRGSSGEQWSRRAETTSPFSV